MTDEALIALLREKYPVLGGALHLLDGVTDPDLKDSFNQQRGLQDLKKLLAQTYVDLANEFQVWIDELDHKPDEDCETCDGQAEGWNMAAAYVEGRADALHPGLRRPRNKKDIPGG